MSESQVWGRFVGQVISLLVDAWISYFLGKKYGIEVGCVCFFALSGISTINSKLADLKLKADA